MSKSCHSGCHRCDSLHTKGGFRHKSAIFADFNEVRGVHTGTDKKEVKSKNNDFIGGDRGTGERCEKNRMTSSLRLNWSVIKA